jgi:metal-sulfur cluster biosynthetic enzyme
VDLKEKVINRLKEVIDPGTLTDVVSMGLIKNLAIREDGKITLDFQPSSPACPLALPLALKIKDALMDLNEGEDPCITIIDHTMADEINRYLKEK